MRRSLVVVLVTVAVLASAQATSAASWATQKVPVGQVVSGSLSAVSCAGTSCTAVGDYLTGRTGSRETLAEQYSGGTWSIVATPKLNSGFSSGVSCVSASDCIAVGENVGAREGEALVWRLGTGAPARPHRAAFWRRGTAAAGQ